MKRFVEGDDSTQRTLFPASLDDYIDDENMVHVIDALVDALDLPHGHSINSEAVDNQGRKHHET